MNTELYQKLKNAFESNSLSSVFKNVFVSMKRKKDYDGIIDLAVVIYTLEDEMKHTLPRDMYGQNAFSYLRMDVKNYAYRTFDHAMLDEFLRRTDSC